MTEQRWFLLVHGRVVEVGLSGYLQEARKRDWPGITRFDGSEPTWQDFIDRLVKALEDAA